MGMFDEVIYQVALAALEGSLQEWQERRWDSWGLWKRRCWPS
jgi:hypothetical protein